MAVCNKGIAQFYLSTTYDGTNHTCLYTHTYIHSIIIIIIITTTTTTTTTIIIISAKCTKNMCVKEKYAVSNARNTVQ